MILLTTGWWCRFRNLSTRIKGVRTECWLTTSENSTKLLTSIPPSRLFKSKSAKLRSKSQRNRRMRQRLVPLIEAILCRKRMQLTRCLALTMSILHKIYRFSTTLIWKIKLRFQLIKLRLWIVLHIKIQDQFQLFYPTIPITGLVSIETGS